MSRPDSEKAINMLIVAVVVLVASVVAVFGWGMFKFHEGSKTDYWRRDYAPTAADLARFAEQRYPSSIHRVFEVGHSSRVNGDGESLTIYSYDPADSEAFISVIMAGNGWAEGLPKDSHWSYRLERDAPRHLWITASDVPEDFVHAVKGPDELTWRLINRKKGVVYLYTVRR